MNNTQKIDKLNKILESLWQVEQTLHDENLLGHARSYIEITIREIDDDDV